jgi:hypothetical protein
MVGKRELGGSEKPMLSHEGAEFMLYAPDLSTH